ncbi:hypothetical protein IE53DRAFT_385008 [Violaceomyces palustris]|uniref:Uncharacterized protein n=1 Tax=Violaceomyces palustris TaxID=1673888 RepID=A0ACD0P3A1_9BASI|nr:hypothetical protein IE53DRAFT_385008 [Violaceomyces palustris]
MLPLPIDRVQGLSERQKALCRRAKIFNVSQLLLQPESELAKSLCLPPSHVQAIQRVVSLQVAPRPLSILETITPNFSDDNHLTRPTPPPPPPTRHNRLTSGTSRSIPDQITSKGTTAAVQGVGLTSTDRRIGVATSTNRERGKTLSPRLASSFVPPTQTEGEWGLELPNHHHRHRRSSPNLGSDAASDTDADAESDSSSGQGGSVESGRKRRKVNETSSDASRTRIKTRFGLEVELDSDKGGGSRRRRRRAACCGGSADGSDSGWDGSSSFSSSSSSCRSEGSDEDEHPLLEREEREAQASVGAKRATMEAMRRGRPGHILSTGEAGLDRILRGGFRKGCLTEVVGESASGKTQLVLQTAVYAALGLCILEERRDGTCRWDFEDDDDDDVAPTSLRQALRGVGMVPSEMDSTNGQGVAIVTSQGERSGFSLVERLKEIAVHAVRKRWERVVAIGGDGFTDGRGRDRSLLQAATDDEGGEKRKEDDRVEGVTVRNSSDQPSQPVGRFLDRIDDAEDQRRRPGSGVPEEEEEEEDPRERAAIQLAIRQVLSNVHLACVSDVEALEHAINYTLPGLIWRLSTQAGQNMPSSSSSNSVSPPTASSSSARIGLVIIDSLPPLFQEEPARTKDTMIERSRILCRLGDSLQRLCILGTRRSLSEAREEEELALGQGRRTLANDPTGRSIIVVNHVSDVFGEMKDCTKRALFERCEHLHQHLDRRSSGMEDPSQGDEARRAEGGCDGRTRRSRKSDRLACSAESGDGAPMAYDEQSIFFNGSLSSIPNTVVRRTVAARKRRLEGGEEEEEEEEEANQSQQQRPGGMGNDDEGGEGEGQGGTTEGEGEIDRLGPRSCQLGQVWNNCLNVRLMLSKTRGRTVVTEERRGLPFPGVEDEARRTRRRRVNIRRATVVFSPFGPSGLDVVRRKLHPSPMTTTTTKKSSRARHHGPGRPFTEEEEEEEEGEEEDFRFVITRQGLEGLEEEVGTRRTGGGDPNLGSDREGWKGELGEEVEEEAEFTDAIQDEELARLNIDLDVGDSAVSPSQRS